jgi:hypothetical protein
MAQTRTRLPALLSGLALLLVPAVGAATNGTNMALYVQVGRVL